MSHSFTKLFSSITESTVWQEPNEVRLVWITMLAMSDRQGRVLASLPGLANRARVPLEDAEKAIIKFQEPDKYSRTQTFEGRRIEPIDGGWRLLNYEKYRSFRDEEAERERKKVWAAKTRAISRLQDSTVAQSSAPTTTVAQSSAEFPQAEAEAEAEAEPKKKKREKPDVLADIPESLKTEEFLRAWKEWEAYRREKKAPLTPTSRKRQLQEMETFGPAASIKAIEESIKAGWRGVFPAKHKTDAPPPKPLVGAHPPTEPKYRHWFDEDAPAWARKIGGDMAAGLPVSEDDVARYSQWMYGG